MRVLVLWSDGTNPNLGVRALAQGTAALVRSAHPDAEVVTQSYGHGEAPSNIGVPRTLLMDRLVDRRGLRRWVRGFDYVVDTRAGDSFADIYGQARLNQMSAMAEFVRSCGVPLVMGPQTIGPFSTRRGTLVGRWSLARADAVITRDPTSALAARQMGRTPDAEATDVVFALEIPEASTPHDVLFNVSGLLWTGDAHGSSRRYQELVRAAIQQLQARGRTVTLLSHVLDSDFPDSDSSTVREIASELHLEAVVPSSLDDVRAVLKGSRLVIGSRMHACLNALSVGTPAIPLAYSRKFAPLMADLGWPHVVQLNSDTALQGLMDLVDRQELLSEAAPQVARVAAPKLELARECLRSLR